MKTIGKKQTQIRARDVGVSLVGLGPCCIIHYAGLGKPHWAGENWA